MLLVLTHRSISISGNYGNNEIMDVYSSCVSRSGNWRASITTPSAGGEFQEFESTDQNSCGCHKPPNLNINHLTSKN